MKPVAVSPSSASVRLVLLAACLTMSTLPVLAVDPPAAVSATSAATSAPPAIPQTPQIDASAMALLKKVQTTMLALKSYRADCQTSTTPDPQMGKKPGKTRYEMAALTAVKPNLMHYDAWEDVSVSAQDKRIPRHRVPDMTYICDGKTQWQQFGVTYRVHKKALGDDFDLSTELEPWGGFYSADDSPYQDTKGSQKDGDRLLEVRREKSERVDGVLCDRIFTHTQGTYDGETTDTQTTWFIGADGLVRRQVERTTFGGKLGDTRDAILSHIQTNFHIANRKALFAYTPPPGVKSEAQQAAEAPKLLTRGTLAPDFTAVDKDGAAVKLSDLRGKVVVLDFWASWCPPCKAAMPHNQEVAKKLQTANLPMVLLALDNSEDQPAFVAWVKAHPELDALRFVFADQKTDNVGGASYHVSGIPTQYIIDAQGIVRTASVGYSGANDELEKAVRAAMLPLPVK